MRHAFSIKVFTVFLCALAFLVGATPTLMAQGGTASSNRVIVIGCIKPAAGATDPKSTEWSITDFRGGSTPTYLLDGKDSKLAPWIGYAVEITGTVAPGYKAGSKDAPKLNVEKVDRISRTCAGLGKR